MRPSLSSAGGNEVSDTTLWSAEGDAWFARFDDADPPEALREQRVGRVGGDRGEQATGCLRVEAERLATYSGRRLQVPAR